MLVGRTLGAPDNIVPRRLASAKAVVWRQVGEVPSLRVAYLLLAVITGIVPTAEQVVDFEREWRLTGTQAAIDRACSLARAASRWRFGPTPTVRINSGTIVDVHDTAHTTFTSGIQRVTRSVLPFWAQRTPLQLVAWTANFEAPRTLSPAETALATGEWSPAPDSSPRPEVIIPYECTWLLPEIAVDVRRATRVHSIALYSGSRTVAIGHDCIPITSAETAGAGMPGGFSNYLAALAAFTVVAPTSCASATEFAGWHRMLGGSGLAGPAIRTVELATVSDSADSAGDADALTELGLSDSETIVFVVGSHEPRKNHLALLQAAELTWRRGRDFTLVMVGGNSWNRGEFDAALGAARARGRRVVLLTAAPDELVWALYRRARFTVFPSLNEGFGLPIVESISVGTPVITSAFGSMREAGEGFGALLVDPHDDDALAEAMDELLTDDALLARLKRETAGAPQRTWGDYADELLTAFGLDAAR
jgi:glycosyltransferase involved in cell wall biosynthesis